jgi:hypothetical protein
MIFFSQRPFLPFLVVRKKFKRSARFIKVGSEARPYPEKKEKKLEKTLYMNCEDTG